MKREFKLRKEEKPEKRIRFNRLSRVKRKNKSIIPYLLGIIVIVFLLYNLDSIVKNFSSGFNFFTK